MIKGMTRHGFSLAFAASLLSATPSNAAPDNFTIRDLRCFTIMLPEFQNKNAKIAKESQEASFYFLGRIESRVP